MMDEDVAIRRLGPADGQAARGVLAVFAEAFEDAETYLGDPPTAAYLSDLVGRDDVIVLVAEAEGAVVGAVVAYVLRKLERGRAEVYVYDLAVMADHRRRGIGRALMEAVRPIARAAGAWVIYVQADHGDDPAIALYDSMGAREDVLHFDIAVE